MKQNESLTGLPASSKEAFRKVRTLRSRFVYSVTLILLVVAGIYFYVYLKPLLLPILIGLLSAYLCQPVLNYLNRKGFTRWISVVILLGAFLLTVFFLARYFITLIPDDIEMLQYRVSVQEKINERYQSYMGIDDGEGNILYTIAGPELNPLMDSANLWLLLSPEEAGRLVDYKRTVNNMEADEVEQLLQQQLSRTLYANPDLQAADRLSEENETDLQNRTESDQPSILMGALDILAIWLVMPVMFLFFLIDNGQIRKSMVSLVPNNYFEMSLSVLNNVDKAIGNYLRGTLLETLLMSVTLWLLLMLIGFEIKIAVVLAIISGIANIIPLFGMFIGIALCVGFALIAENVYTFLPFITVENLVIWTIIIHLIAQALDNALYKPFVLGKAVDLHPMIVFLGAIAGSLLFGFVGLLFAIPAIVILKEVISTFFKEMKAYFLIY
jgi:predicted PurR-regulated permease PerM